MIFSEKVPKKIVPQSAATEATFIKSLTVYMEQAQSGLAEGGCLIARNDLSPMWHTSGNLVPVPEVVTAIMRSIQTHAKDQYLTCFDFSDKSAEGIFLGIVSILDNSYGKWERNRWWGFEPYTDMAGFLKVLAQEDMKKLVRNHYDPVKVFADTIQKYNSATT